MGRTLVTAVAFTIFRIAALLAPLHTRLEKWITHQRVEKNKKKRVVNARKLLEENEKPQ